MSSGRTTLQQTIKCGLCEFHGLVYLRKKNIALFTLSFIKWQNMSIRVFRSSCVQILHSTHFLCLNSSRFHEIRTKLLFSKLLQPPVKFHMLASWLYNFFPHSLNVSSWKICFVVTNSFSSEKKWFHSKCPLT